MKRHEFWEQVEQRVEENQQITAGGLPNAWAGVLAWVGLKFWIVGAGISLVITGLVFSMQYAAVMKLVRTLIWR